MSESAIHFSISFKEPQAHYAEIEMLIPHVESDHIDLKMPVWTPGSYLVREYSRHIEHLYATSANGKLACEKTSKNTWRVAAGKNAGPIHVFYRIYGFEVSVRTNFIDADHAFISPAATFLYIDGLSHQPCQVTVHLPEQWASISTGLPKLPTASNTYYADNFDTLFDSPLEIGNQDIWHFEAAGVQHEFAMVGGGSYNKQQLTSDLVKIIEQETAIWGENPNSNYVFITHNYNAGSGGLEHLNSTVLAASRNAYKIDAAYKNFLSLAAHEYFHLWNVKRLRPKALGPFNYDAENYTAGLWIMEGFTAYYDNLIIRRCGFYSVKEYLNALANEFNLVYNRAGHRVQSAAQASFDTWIKQYRPDENSINSSISYYNKGAMLAVALDTHIIARTQGKLRLDDVLREAYNTFYKKEGRGFEEDEFRRLAERVTGVDLGEIFDAAHNTVELDYNRFFREVGFELIDLNQDSQELSLGIRIVEQDGRLFIKNVERSSGAWDAGLNVNDELIAINGNRLDSAGKELDFALAQGQYEDIVDLLIARDGRIRTIHTPLRYCRKQLWSIQPRIDATEQQKERGRIWLSVVES
ncbi:M61 family metallopeptidase [Sphingobacterium paludis]|uniref:Putative metalloprotease with PDZ domain n=1 Tax=Sphingobacterium paludis TaxID=1476465 RepID=A0A4R7D7J3_9SPHI|nr:PDZ domain-containing protein [Sphingobacterium paludis]TDS17159.1 putative metalloprotease with PDZ domain [Sphingobacterium paludis]